MALSTRVLQEGARGRRRGRCGWSSGCWLVLVGMACFPSPRLVAWEKRVGRTKGRLVCVPPSLASAV